MARLWEQLSAPFDRADDRMARHLLVEHWGLRADALERLDSERDDTFHVTVGDDQYTLKISHPGDDPHVIGMQSAAMLHAAKAGLPVPQAVPTADGGTHPIHGDRVVWLLTWIDGELLLGRTASPDALGRTLGSLNAALATFEHPAAHRTFAWDLAAIAELEDLLPLVPRDSVASALRDVPDLTNLPSQVIHGDYHPGNLLVSGEQLVGVLDFGDVLHTARVVDLAIALNYLPAGEWDAFTAGFESVVPLTAAEREALLPLIRARMAQRILLGANAAQGRDDVLQGIGKLADRLETL